MAENPFAPPAGDKLTPAAMPWARDAWRDGDVLVAQNGANLGPRCLKCGVTTPQDAIKPRKVQWYPRWVAFLVILSPLVMIIVMLILMKRATLHGALCTNHQTQFWIGQIGGIGCVVGSFGVLFLPMLLHADSLMMAGLIGFFVCVIVGVILLITMGVLFKPQRITNTVGFYKGFHASILRDLPTWDGSETA